MAIRVLVNSNILISYLLSPARQAPAAIIHAALLRRFVLLLPAELFAEVRRKVVEKSYLAARIGKEDVAQLESLLGVVGEATPPIRGSLPAYGRDPKDDYLVAYAIRDGADFLVTRDRDLLDLAASIPQPRIVSPGEFRRKARASGFI